MDKLISFNINNIPCENNNKYKVTIKVPISLGWISHVHINFQKEGNNFSHRLEHKTNEDGFAIFESDISLDTSALYKFFFNFDIYGTTHFYTKSGINNSSVNQDNFFSMSANFKTPDWAKGKVMYHIFVDRFKRGNPNLPEKMNNRTVYSSWNEKMKISPDKEGRWNIDFYGGDLKGIIDSLDYIASLGTSIIYLSPVVHSQSNHRYDTADYENVDPYVGNNDDLKLLCKKAHEKGMYVVLDAVFNHTGNDSIYFNQFKTFNTIGAFQSKESEYYDFYKKDGSGNFSYWWGMENLPVCDGKNQKWQNYIVGENGIIDKWFKCGIDGLRLDVADELTDEFIEKIRVAVHRNKEDGFILGEVWENPMRKNRTYISSGKGMDSVMNYILVDALIRYFKYKDVGKLASVLYELKHDYPKETLLTLMNFTSTHDISRAINIFSENEFNPKGQWGWTTNTDSIDYFQNHEIAKENLDKGKMIYKSYASTLAFMPGIFSVFYGDECGIEGLGNLANRKPFPWGKEDLRLYEFFKRLGAIKKRETFLEKADFNPRGINEDYFEFERIANNSSALVLVNRTSNIIKPYISSEYKDGEKIFSINEERDLILKEHDVMVLKKAK